MKIVRFYDAAPVRPSLFQHDSERQLVKIPRHEYVWSYPGDSVSVEVQLPTDRIRILGSLSESDGNFATIVGFGGGKCLFVPDEGTPLAMLHGERRTLIAHKDEYILDITPSVVRPSAQWVAEWLNPDAWAESVIDARKEMLNEASGFSFEVRDTLDGMAFLQSFHRSVDTLGTPVTRTASIAFPHPINSLELVSGQAPSERFSVKGALVEARTRCNQIKSAQAAEDVVSKSEHRRHRLSA